MKTIRSRAPVGETVKSPFWRFVLRYQKVLWGLLGLGLFLAVWEIVAVKVNLDIVLPRVGEVAVAFGKLWESKSFYLDTGRTIVRCLIGFGIAFAAGLVFGVLGGVCKPVRQVLQPIVALFRAAPTMALTLLLMIWFYTDKTPIAVGFLMVFPVIYTTIADSIATAPTDLLEMATVYRLSPWDKVRYIYLPHATPMVLSAANTAFGLNIKATVSAEVLAYTAHSIGLNMYNAKNDILWGASTLFAWLLVAVLVSLVFGWLIKGASYLILRRYQHANL